jgi:FkbM family methyltransferase
MRKKLEKIGTKLGYKYLRYGVPYSWACWKNRKEINLAKSILADELSVKIFAAAIKCRKTRNTKYMAPFFDKNVISPQTLPSGEVLAHDLSQYFPKYIVELSPNEVFVDGGGYVGDTTLLFIEQVQGQFTKIHVFEPEKENINKLQRNFDLAQIDKHKVKVHSTGLYSEAADVFFSQNGSGASIDKKGKVAAKLVALDTYLTEEERSEITYVKLDIEGAELSALEGMRQTISRYKPKLAVCIYHKPHVDVWRIPLWIHRLNPDYKFYIRQHALYCETVCYAV